MKTASLLCLAALGVASTSEAATQFEIKNRRIEPRQTLAGALHDAQLPDEQV